MRTKHGTLNAEFGMFAVAAVFLVYEVYVLTASEPEGADFGIRYARETVSEPIFSLAEIGTREDTRRFTEGMRANPFAPYSRIFDMHLDLASVKPPKPPTQPAAPKPPVKPPPSPPKPSAPPQPPPPPPQPPEPAAPTAQPKPWEMPVSLAGVMSVDSERFVVMRIKDNQYYLRARIGEKLENLGIEVADVRGEEVLLRLLKTGELVTVRDLLRRMRRPEEVNAGTAGREQAGDR